jgi:cysteine desulfurase
MTVYLDNAATTKVRHEAAEIMCRVMEEDYGNPSSTHLMGRQAKVFLKNAREEVAGAIGASPEEIYFTSGGTEADNWAIYRGTEIMRRRGRHIVITGAEHDAVGRPAAVLETKGYEVTRIMPGKSGRVDPEEIAAAVREDTAVVSVILVNNETGAVNPVKEIAGLIKKRGLSPIIHTDAVQALCKVDINVKELGADLISLSSHKIHGPKGCGALYIKKGVKLGAFIEGGGQENGLRSGTEAMPAIVGFGCAAALGRKEMAENTKRMREIKEHIAAGIISGIDGAEVLGESGAPHIISIGLPGYRSEVIMNFLEAEGIFVSKSSACKKGKRSHVLEAMGLPAKVIDGAIRVSLSRYTTMEEADYFIDALVRGSKKLIKVL